MGTTTFYTHKNLAISTVATAPSPATSGTSVVVATGQGSRFATGPATICPASTTPDPANAEVVLITNVSTDTLTITRAQESSTARSVIVGDIIFQGPTAATLAAIETAVGALETPTINAQTGTSYTGVLGDAGKVVTMSNASANTFTIPANASVAYPVGTIITVIQAGAGATTIAITSDTLNSYSPSSAGTCSLKAQKCGVTLVKTGTTTWYALGNLT